MSEGRNLMNTQGIGGFVQAKGLNRMAQTVNQTNEPLIRGQYELQNTAMTANERLEQAKLAEHQRQQNLETWTPDKDMMGELGRIWTHQGWSSAIRYQGEPDGEADARTVLGQGQAGESQGD